MSTDTVLNVYRLGVSPYQNQKFKEWEKESLEKIEGIRYLNTLEEGDAQILLTNTHFKPKKDLTQNNIKTENVQLIIHPNSGYDNFPKDFVTESGIPIVLGNPIRAHAVSNYILASIFERETSIPNESYWNKSRVWDRNLLCQKTVAVIGLGHIGSIIKKSLEPLAAEVMVFDPFKGFPSLKEGPIEKADIVILSCSLNEKNLAFINEKIFKKMKEDVLFINPSRGKLVNEGHLIHFLEKHPKAFAFLDVFEKEPVSYEKFSHLKNIKLSSHIAGVFKELDQYIIRFEEDILRSYMKAHREKETDALWKGTFKDLLLHNKIHNGIIA
ncbi:MAG: hypothetical protein CME68_07815 [Halobacteriovoraceae bacterium]|nr:hypothetical protein [Halobacteriovoraceae bacterium]